MEFPSRLLIKSSPPREVTAISGCRLPERRYWIGHRTSALPKLAKHLRDDCNGCPTSLQTDIVFEITTQTERGIVHPEPFKYVTLVNGGLMTDAHRAQRPAQRWSEGLRAGTVRLP